MLKENEILKLYKKAKKEKNERLQANKNNIRIDVRFSKRLNKYIINIFVKKNNKYKKIEQTNILILNNNYKIENIKEINEKIKEELLLNKKEAQKKKIKMIDYMQQFIDFLDKQNLTENRKRQKKNYAKKNLKEFLKDKDEIKEEKDIVEFLQFCLENLRNVGIIKEEKYKKKGCWSLQNNIIILRDFFSFLLLKSIITKEQKDLVYNFRIKEYFSYCKNLNNTSFKTFGNFEALKNFYNILVCTKLFLIQKIQKNEKIDILNKHFNSYKNGKELEEIGEMYLYLKHKNIKNYRKLLVNIIALEILLLTGMRKKDLLKLNNTNEYIKEDNYIIFLKSKNGEDYYLYLTDYLKQLFNIIFNLKEKFGIILNEQMMKRFIYFLQNNNFIGQEINIHGFRSAFKTFCLQFLKIDNVVIEQQLGHKISGVEKHYLKSSLKEKKIELLKDFEHLVKQKQIYDKDFLITNYEKVIEEAYNFLSPSRKLCKSIKSCKIN